VTAFVLFSESVVHKSIAKAKVKDTDVQLNTLIIGINNSSTK